ncbi:MAG TPA: hypothetical protein VM344_04960, partial [Vitreimonas sp.]|nr:hypothetical protein [Vitreimonas sp.]
IGTVLVAGVALATLPRVGLDLWGRWIDGLQAYQVSQRLLPEYLYGFGLARYLPLVLVGAFAVLLTVLAFGARDRREQLSRLGVATVVGSPSLFAHGWIVALPAMGRLHTPWFWLAFGLTACSPGLAWFLALAIVVVSWYRPAMRKRPQADAWHPLGAATRPWFESATIDRPVSGP